MEKCIKHPDREAPREVMMKQHDLEHDKVKYDVFYFCDECYKTYQDLLWERYGVKLGGKKL